MKADSPDGPHANWKTVDLDRGEVLFTVGDRVRYAFFPIGCVLSSLAGLTDGSTLEVSMFGPEGAAGVLGAVGSCDASTKVVVLVSGKAVRVPVRWLRAEFGRSERVRSALLRHIENVYFQAQQSALCASRHSVEARLARWLLSIQDRAHCRNVRFTHEFVAGHLGVNRTSVTLAAAELQRAGIITYRRGVLSIVDREGLEKSSCECYGAIRDRMRRLLR
jgi:CRP-like cAMP-binding protein